MGLSGVGRQDWRREGGCSRAKRWPGSSVRLRDGGPDIPDELLAAQELGNVIFLCGAGVSKNAGLPLFEGLVQQVYEALGET